jgi:stage V sporulation protein SpoVS
MTNNEDYVIRAAQDSDVNALAGSIALRLRADKIAVVQSIGGNAVNQAIKAIITARRYLAPNNQELVLTPSFKMIELAYGEKTAIRFTIKLIETGE